MQNKRGNSLVILLSPQRGLTCAHTAQEIRGMGSAAVLFHVWPIMANLSAVQCWKQHLSLLMSLAYLPL